MRKTNHLTRQERRELANKGLSPEGVRQMREADEEAQWLLVRNLHDVANSDAVLGSGEAEIQSEYTERGMSERATPRRTTSEPRIARSGLFTSWHKDKLSELEIWVQEQWSTLVGLRILEGVTFQGATALQGAAAGSRKLFPQQFHVPGHDTHVLEFAFIDENWRVRVSRRCRLRTLEVIFLSEAEIIETMTLRKGDWYPISDEIIDASDRFIVAEPQKSESGK